MADVLAAGLVDEGSATRLVGDDATAKMAVAGEEGTKQDNTPRKKSKPRQEGEGQGAEPKEDDTESPQKIIETDAAQDGGQNERSKHEMNGIGHQTAEEPGQPLVVTPSPPSQEAKNEREENAKDGEEKNGKPKKKGKKKKAKKEKRGGDGPEAASGLAPRTTAEGKEGEKEEKKKKKKKKKKKPQAPTAGPSEADVASPKIDQGVDGKAKNESEAKGAVPQLSSVHPASAVRLHESGSSNGLVAPPSPSLGVKFAQRLSLANVIPKLSTLPFEKKPRTFNSNVYNQPFSGKTLVKWMVEADTGVKMELEAMILGELMLNAGVIVPLSRKVEFSASAKDFYALTEGYVDFTRPRGVSTAGTIGPMGGRTMSTDEFKRSKRASVMLTFRSISMRGFNHLTALSNSKEKDKKEGEAGDAPTNLVYGKSLEEVMALQKDTHPEEKVPIILKTLTKAIIDTDGHKTEGIFRVPGKNDEIARLKAQFNKMDYSITSDDPNDLGGCLKMWFRELKDPLIPNSIYDDCVLVANNPAECLEMVNTRVPELNKTVIYFLLGFLQEMTRHAAVTRMGSANLGMVFAPGLLRCEDVMKMMTNTAHEGAFVKNLIENYRPAE